MGRGPRQKRLGDRPAPGHQRIHRPQAHRRRQAPLLRIDKDSTGGAFVVRRAPQLRRCDDELRKGRL